MPVNHSRRTQPLAINMLCAVLAGNHRAGVSEENFVGHMFFFRYLLPLDAMRFDSIEGQINIYWHLQIVHFSVTIGG